MKVPTKEQLYQLERKIDATLQNLTVLVDQHKRAARTLRAKHTDALNRLEAFAGQPQPSGDSTPP